MTHGSDKRQRILRIDVRLTPTEHAEICDKAERAGLRAGSYARDVLLGAPAPRQVRRPPIERQELSRLLGEIGKVGSNLNQLARDANTGNSPEGGAILSVLASLVEVRTAILKALGRGP
jgi:hypothetical protein